VTIHAHPHQIWNFVFRDRRAKGGPTLAAFWGLPQDAEEEAMAVKTRERSTASVVSADHSAA
jgi:anaerobic magnesium-protoporphyrin IX monomethyl ester cyclase